LIIISDHQQRVFQSVTKEMLLIGVREPPDSLKKLVPDTNCWSCYPNDCYYSV